MVRKAEKENKMEPVGKRAKAIWKGLISTKQGWYQLLMHCLFYVGLRGGWREGSYHTHFLSEFHTFISRANRIGPNTLGASIGCPFLILPFKGLRGTTVSCYLRTCDGRTFWHQDIQKYIILE